MNSGIWLAACIVGFAGSAFGAPSPAPGGEGPGPEAQQEPGDARPTEAEERYVLEFIRQHNPEMADRLAEARERRPAEFRQKMHHIVMMYRHPEVRETWVRQQESEQKVRKLADSYRKADAKQKEALRPGLEQALSDQFDSKVAEHELRVKKMQEEIGRLRDQIAKRKALKSQILKKRLAEITGDDVESWNW